MMKLSKSKKFSTKPKFSSKLIKKQLIAKPSTPTDTIEPPTLENAKPPRLPFFEESVIVAYKSRQYIECIKIIERILKITPKEHANHYKILLAAANTMIGKNYKRSHNLLNEVLTLNPFDAYALYGKGVAFYFEQKYEESIRFFDLAIEADENGMDRAKNMKMKAQIQNKQVRVVLRKLNVDFGDESDEDCGVSFEMNLRKNEEKSESDMDIEENEDTHNKSKVSEQPERSNKRNSRKAEEDDDKSSKFVKEELKNDEKVILELKDTIYNCDNEESESIENSDAPNICIEKITKSSKKIQNESGKSDESASVVKKESDKVKEKLPKSWKSEKKSSKKLQNKSKNEDKPQQSSDHGDHDKDRDLANFEKTSHANKEELEKEANHLKSRSKKSICSRFEAEPSCSDLDSPRALRSRRSTNAKNQKTPKKHEKIHKNGTKDDSDDEKESKCEEKTSKILGNDKIKSEDSRNNEPDSSTKLEEDSLIPAKTTNSSDGNPPENQYFLQDFKEIPSSSTLNLDSSLEDDLSDLRPTTSANSFAQLYFNRGLDFYMIGELLKSLKFFKKSLDLEPDFEEADEMTTKAQEFIDLLDVVDINMSEKNYEAVVEICNEGLDIDEENDFVNRKFYFHRGLAYYHLKDNEKSMKDYQEYDRLTKKVEKKD